ncbi:MAG: hypothetical protein ACD_67C00209G0001 [uncultured bacterium]|nr:MAG: hypothetical protein ACD_67C00209G0001 [uncultured bacterium]
MRPMFIPMFSQTCTKNMSMIPIAMRKPRLSGEFMAIVRMRQNMTPYSPITKSEPRRPSSSAIEAKIKSVCFSGKKFSCD